MINNCPIKILLHTEN